MAVEEPGGMWDAMEAGVLNEVSGYEEIRKNRGLSTLSSCVGEMLVRV